MSVSGRGIVLAAGVSMVGTFVLVALLALVAPALGRSTSGAIPLLVFGFVIGAVVRFVAGLLAGRAARLDRLDLRDALLTGVLGCLAGYVVFEVADALLSVLALHRDYRFSWQLVYGVLPWLLFGGLGGLYGWRRTTGGRETRAQRRAAEREIY